MKNVKLEKGITLIALIITIVVLLILAVVTIGTIKDSNIVEYAQNASSEYNKGKEKEEGILSQYEAMLDAQQGIGPWKLQEDGETIKNGKTGVETKIGGEFSNEDVLKATGGTKSTYEGTWTVLGTEHGKLKLVSTTDVASSITLGLNDPEVYVKDKDGNITTTLKPEIVEVYDKEGEETNLELEKAIWSYQHSVETLNEHAKTATGIESARSITIEDLEAKEVLNITNDKKVELSPNYGRIYNYFYNKDNQKVSSKNKAPGSNTWSTVSLSSHASEIFVDKDGKIVLVDSENNEVTLDYTRYIKYDFSDNQKNKFENSLGQGKYWLASPCTWCQEINAYFLISHVSDSCINNSYVFGSIGDRYSSERGVRAVVYL